MKQTKELIWITIGTLVLALGLQLFLIPANLAVGGITGLAIVINQFFPLISVGVSLFVLNTLLYIIGIILIGREFGWKTIYASFALSGIITVFDFVYPLQKPLVEDVLLNLFYGILLGAIGLGIVFYQNASTGGTDIVAKILNKFLDLDIGKGLMLADLVVVILAMFAFGLSLGLYALLGILLNGAIVDNVIEGMDRKYRVTVISKQYEAIRSFIIKDIDRGVTLYNGLGGYSNEEIKIIHGIMSKREFIRLKKFVADLDPTAFFTVTTVKEVFGHGFKLF